MQRAKTGRLLDDNEKKNPVRRMKDVKLTVPIAYGTISFWLGKKADEFHHLKLYPEDDSGPQNTKKPVVVESYDELVVTEPSEAYFSRIKNYPVVTVNGLLPPAGFSPPVSAGGGNEKEKK